MALPTNTLTLVTTQGGVPLEGEWRVRLLSVDGVAVDTGTGAAVVAPPPKDTVGGVVTFELEDNTHADFEPSTAKWRAWFKSHDRRREHRYDFKTDPFDMDADKDLDDVLTGVAGPIDSSVAAEAIAAKNAAEAAAASVNRGEPNGVAGLDADGDVIDAAGDKVTGGGGGVSSWNDLTDKPTTFPPATHNHDSSYYTKSQVDTAVNAKRTAANTDPIVIIETSTGVWSADAPAGRTGGSRPCEFRGTSDPADATDGITTPANIRDGDVWVHPTA